MIKIKYSQEKSLTGSKRLVLFQITKESQDFSSLQINTLLLVV